MRRDLRIHQPLTTTHDTAAAWSGLGFAASHLWHGRADVSVAGVLSALLYLKNIALLQVAMPSMFLLQSVTVSRSVLVGTQGLPSYPLSSHNYGLTSSE
jgi:hypothetical protein